jgi:hypothetical protein
MAVCLLHRLTELGGFVLVVIKGFISHGTVTSWNLSIPPLPTVFPSEGWG